MHHIHVIYRFCRSIQCLFLEEIMIKGCVETTHRHKIKLYLGFYYPESTLHYQETFSWQYSLILELVPFHGLTGIV